MSDAIRDYLDTLRRALAGSDPATVQDALADAEDHLRSAVAQLREAEGLDDGAAAARALDEYGAAAEVASAYRAYERLSAPRFPSASREGAGMLLRFFGSLWDPRAWSALLFLLISLVTGIVFFYWFALSISLSLVFLLFIFGAPLAVLMLWASRGLLVVEGRMVEGMLGIRMPRRSPVRKKKGIGYRELWALLKDGHTWRALFYLLLKLPIGIVSFAILMVLLGYSLEMMAAPILIPIFDLPIVTTGRHVWYAPDWLLPLLFIAGFLDLVVTLHICKGLGRLQGRMARRFLLARDV
jgi:hypothetical protein